MSTNSSQQPSVNNSILVMDQSLEEYKFSEIKQAIQQKPSKDPLNSKKSTKISIQVVKLVRNKTHQPRQTNIKPSKYHNSHVLKANEIKKCQKIKSFQEMYFEQVNLKKTEHFKINPVLVHASKNNSHHSSISSSLEKMRNSLENQKSQYPKRITSCKNSNLSVGDKNCFLKAKQGKQNANKQNINILQNQKKQDHQVKPQAHKSVHFAEAAAIKRQPSQCADSSNTVDLGTVKRKILRTKSIRSRSNSELSAVAEEQTGEAKRLHFQQTSSVQNSIIGQQNSIIGQQFCQVINRVIDHGKHPHIRGNIECFFSFQEFVQVLESLFVISARDSGKNQSSALHALTCTMWEQLGGKTYGGVVRQNLLAFISIICQGSGRHQQPEQSKQIKRVENIYIDSNLKLKKFSQDQIISIQSYYFELKIKKSDQKASGKDQTQSPPSQANVIRKTQDLHTTSQSKDLSQVIHQNDENDLFCDIQLGTQSNQKQIKIQDESVQEIIQGQAQPLRNIRYTDFTPDSEIISNEMLASFGNQNTQNRHLVDFSPKMMPELAEVNDQLKSTTLFRVPLSEISPNQAQNKTTSNFPVDKRKALLSVDVNLGEGNSEKLVVYEGQTPYEVSLRLAQKYNIDEALREKFQFMLDSHVKNLLFKIQEVSQELLEDESQEIARNSHFPYRGENKCNAQDPQQTEEEQQLLEQSANKYQR